MPDNIPRSSPAKERRSGADRRRVDLDRAGRPERRRGVEARKPDVVELEMTKSEWLALSTEPVATKPSKKPQKIEK